MRPLTAKDVIEHSRPDMLTQDPPADVPLCRQDPDWAGLFRLYLAEVEESAENSRFFDDVDTFDKQPSLAKAQEISTRYVRDGSPLQVNISAAQRRRVMRWFEPDPDYDIFKDAYEEVSTGEDPERDAAFRLAVDDWRHRGRDGSQALTILDDHVREGAVARVYLSEKTRTALLTALDTGGFFDEASREIIRMLNVDQYKRFVKAVLDLRPGPGDIASGQVEVQAISRPGLPGGIVAKQAFRARNAASATDTWIPDNAAVDAAHVKSRDNVKAIPNNGTGAISAGGAMMLVGTGHDPRVVAYVERQGDCEQGVVAVTKGQRSARVRSRFRAFPPRRLSWRRCSKSSPTRGSRSHKVADPQRHSPGSLRSV